MDGLDHPSAVVATALVPPAPECVVAPVAERRLRWWHLADRVGSTASFLCAIHCVLLPFVLTLLPLVGLGFLAGHRFERGFVVFAVALALLALANGYRRHRRPLPLRMAVPGVLLLLLGVTWAEQYPIAVHSTLVACGGLLVAGAHFINLHADRCRENAPDSACRAHG